MDFLGERQRTRKVSSQESVSAWTQKSSHPLAFFVHVFFVLSPSALSLISPNLKSSSGSVFSARVYFSLLFCSLFLGAGTVGSERHLNFSRAMHIKKNVHREWRKRDAWSIIHARASRFPDLFLALGETLTAWKIIPWMENLFPSARTQKQLGVLNFSV
jgi:hypothetical protein